MPVKNLARLAAVDPVATTLVPLPFKTLSLSFALLFLAGCNTVPSVSAGPDPSDPGARTSRVDYRSSIGSYTSQRPVAPAAWKKQNEQVTPAPKPGE